MDPTTEVVTALAEPHGLVAVISSSEFYITAIAVVAWTTFLKKAIRVFGRVKGSAFLQNPWVLIFLEVGNIPMGSLFGLIPEFLPGESFLERMAVGGVAGFLSTTIYSVVGKFFPKQMEMSGDQKPMIEFKQRQNGNKPWPPPSENESKESRPATRGGEDGKTHIPLDDD